MNYKLYKGDCLEVMDKLIEAGVKVDAIITDPPYGTTRYKWDSVIPFDGMWDRLNKLIKDNGAIALFSSQPFTSELIHSNIKLFRYDLIWDKVATTGFLNANKMPMRRHEVICIFYKKLPVFNKIYEPKAEGSHSQGKVENYTKDRGFVEQKTYGKIKNRKQNPAFRDVRNPTSIVKFSSGNNRHKLHPSQKPVDLLEYLIKTYTDEGDLVLDFTMGSGSTGVACMNTNRKFIGIELDEKYFNIAKDRLENIK